MIPDRLWLGNFMKLDRYDRHYWSLSPTPTETDLRIWISGPGPTDLKKSRSARARVSRRPRPIPYPAYNLSHRLQSTMGESDSLLTAHLGTGPALD